MTRKQAIWPGYIYIYILYIYADYVGLSRHLHLQSAHVYLFFCVLPTSHPPKFSTEVGPLPDGPNVIYKHALVITPESAEGSPCWSPCFGSSPPKKPAQSDGFVGSSPVACSPPCRSVGTGRGVPGGHTGAVHGKDLAPHRCSR